MSWATLICSGPPVSEFWKYPEGTLVIVAPGSLLDGDVIESSEFCIVTRTPKTESRYGIHEILFRGKPILIDAMRLRPIKDDSTKSS